MLKPLTMWIITNWKIFKVMGIPDHLTCLLWNLYTGQEATVRTRYRTMDWFKIGKGVCQGCILSPCLFNLYEKHIMQNARLDEAQAGIKRKKSRQQLRRLWPRRSCRENGLLQPQSSPPLSPRWQTGPRACRCLPCRFSSSPRKTGVLSLPLKIGLQRPPTAQATEWEGTTTELS